MKKTLMAAALALAAAGFALPTTASAAPLSSPLVGTTLDKENTLRTDVRDWDRGYRGRGYGYRDWHRGYHAGYYRRRPHYGTIVGGIALGALLAGSAYAYAERPPGPGLCWYWADPYERRGYWDYC